MDHLPNRGSPNVFVGNIPYDQTEEQLSELFAQAGRVVDFRLVYDPELHKPKGYGFCQFEDAETAASAVRNLNGISVGGRTLRLDYGGGERKFDRHAGPPAGYRSAPPAPAAPAAPSMPPMPSWTPPQPPQSRPAPPPPVADQAATEAIRTTLSHMPPNQLLDILTQMRTFSLQSPEQAKTVLTSHPQLAYALFQAMLMMNIVNPQVLEQLSAGVTAAPVAPSAPPSSVPYGAGYPYPPVVSAPAPAAPPASEPALPEEQRELLRQVLSLPQAEVDQLGPEQRATIMALRDQYAGRV